MRLFFLILVGLVLVGCSSSEEKEERLFDDQHGKNQYFDRFNELVHFGHYDDYKLLLGYEFAGVSGLLFSTSIFDFNKVAKNQTKTRRFVLLNPHNAPVKGVEYEVVGDPEFVIIKNSCHKLLPARRICSIAVQFQPSNKTESGRKQARLFIRFPQKQEIVKELRGTAL